LNWIFLYLLFYPAWFKRSSLFLYGSATHLDFQ